MFFRRIIYYKSYHCMPPNANFKKISLPFKPREYFQSIPQTKSFPNSDMLAYLYPSAAIYDLRN